MSIVTMAVDCGKDETKISVLGNGSFVHDKFKSRCEKLTSLDTVHTDEAMEITIDSKKYLVGSANGMTSLSNSKADEIHRILTMTALARHVENDDTVNIVIGCPISEYKIDEKRKAFRDYILPAEGTRVEMFVNGKKKYFTIGKRMVSCECISLFSLFPDKVNKGVVGIIDIGGLNVNGAYLVNGSIMVENCFTEKFGKIPVINHLITNLNEKFDLNLSQAEVEAYLDMGYMQGKYKEESKAIIGEALSSQVAKIKDACIHKAWNLDACDLIFIGGTVQILKDRLKNEFGNNIVIPKDTSFANVDGYLTGFVQAIKKD